MAHYSPDQPSQIACSRPSSVGIGLASADVTRGTQICKLKGIGLHCPTKHECPPEVMIGPALPARPYLLAVTREPRRMTLTRQHTVGGDEMLTSSKRH